MTIPACPDCGSAFIQFPCQHGISGCPCSNRTICACEHIDMEGVDRALILRQADELRAWVSLQPLDRTDRELAEERRVHPDTIKKIRREIRARAEERDNQRWRAVMEEEERKHRETVEGEQLIAA